MSQDGEWQDVMESLQKANVPLRLAQGIVEIVDKAGYGVRGWPGESAAIEQGLIGQGRQRHPLEEAINIDKVFVRLCDVYDVQADAPSHCTRVAAYVYARLAVLHQGRTKSPAFLLTEAQRVK